MMMTLPEIIHLQQSAIFAPFASAVGYIYARSLGVSTPSVLFCDSRGYSALPATWPLSWGCCFVLKPLFGFNDFGILIIENSVDRFTGKLVRGRQDVLSLLKQRPNYERRLTQQTIYVETIVRPEAALYAHNMTPPDYKFFTFGGKIGTIAVLEGRKVSGACMAWVDEDFRRFDLHGCICSQRDRCSYGHCDTSRPLKPLLWDEMLRTARLLGEHLGVHMRIDLFASSNGRPVLGEFTPWHTNGKMHCDLRPVPVGVLQNGTVYLRNGLTRRVELVDACRLGRLWREAGEQEGGTLDMHPPPWPLRTWEKLADNDDAKCHLATSLLAPSAWRKAAKALNLRRAQADADTPLRGGRHLSGL